LWTRNIKFRDNLSCQVLFTRMCLYSQSKVRILTKSFVNPKLRVQKTLTLTFVCCSSLKKLATFAFKLKSEFSFLYFFLKRNRFKIRFFKKSHTVCLFSSVWLQNEDLSMAVRPVMFDTSHMHVWSDETKSNKLSGTTAEKKNCSSAWTAKTEIEQPTTLFLAQ
jgi:hypothetical protein